MLENMLSSFASRAAGESASAHLPASMTSTRSQSMIVWSRWAMAITVAEPPLASVNSLRTVSWIRASVSTSTFAVASSRTMILDCLSKARARAASCFWPADRGAPPSLITMSSPIGLASTRGARWARRSAAHTCASSCLRNGSKFSRMLPVNSTGTWGMMAMRERSWCTPRREMSMPSMTMRPASSSMSRNTQLIKLLFPAPVRPTTPALLEAGMVTVRPFSTSGSPGLYLICTPSNRTSPLEGQESGQAPGRSAGGSSGATVYSLMRSTLLNAFSARLASRTTMLVSWVICSA
mmetsp:Transcript_2918/g.8531  ORF Transcript_2918/g.8531 Transcript_2918/m.8531 type:complete len:294 (-) Transcript_2918:2906-3787(-)